MKEQFCNNGCNREYAHAWQACKSICAASAIKNCAAAAKSSGADKEPAEEPAEK